MRSASPAVNGGPIPPERSLPRIGGHLSIAKGFPAMAREAQRIGCQTAQVFTRSPRGGPARPLLPAAVAEMREALDAAGISPLVAHVPYFVAPASAREDLGDLATAMVAEECLRAADLGAAYVVVHAGHRREGKPTDGVAAVIARITAGFRRAAEQSPAAAGGRVEILIEHGAGGRGDAAGTLDLWAECVLGLRAAGIPVGGCLDTAHLWGAGWDLGLDPVTLSSDLAGEEAAVWGRAAAARVLEDIARAGVLPYLRLVHFNDSGAAHGSRLDRHAHIGSGHIPLAFFAALLQSPQLQAVPGIVETDPAGGGVASDVAVLKRLRAGLPAVAAGG